MGFVGRWLGDAVRLGAALFFALAAMQVPALTENYASALAQIAADIRRDIAGREEIARRFHRLDGSGAPLVEALRPLEPANAEGLRGSAAREGSLRAASERLAAAPALLRPLAALRDLADDPGGTKRAVLSLATERHAPQLLLNAAALTYGLVGLVLGLLLADALLLLLGLPFRRRRAIGADGRPA